MTHPLRRSIAAACAVLLFVGLLQSVDAATGSDPDAAVTLTDASPLVGESFGVSFEGLEPDTDVSVQLCNAWIGVTPVGEPLGYDPSLFDGACTELGEIRTDGTGAGDTTVAVAESLVGIAGSCDRGLGAGSFSFGNTVEGTTGCHIAAVTDLDPSDGTTPLATAPISPRRGTGSISGLLLDADGLPIPRPERGSFGQLTVCALDELLPCLGWATWASLLEWNEDGEYSISGLADGRYTIGVHHDYRFGSDFRVVSISGGAAVVNADIRLPAADAASFSNSGSSATVSVAPQPALFDDDLTVSAAGFQPGDEVHVGMCPQQPSYYFSTDEVLGSSCWSTETGTVADASGAATFVIPWDRERFVRTCYDYFQDWEVPGPGSFSFSWPEPACYIGVWDATDAPAAAWQKVDFVQPAGDATLSGTVRYNGEPVGGVSLSLDSPIGYLRDLSADDGSYAFDQLPDGTYNAYAYASTNFWMGDNGVGPVDGESLSLTIAGQVDETADFDFVGPLGSVSGTVRDSNGDPAPGVWVYFRHDSDFGYGSAITDSLGNYRLLGMPDGAVSAQVFDSTNGWASASGVVAGGPLTGVDISLPDVSGSISGRVEDQFGAPPAYAWITACLDDSESSAFGTLCSYVPVDAAGEFTVPNVQAGTWTLTAFLGEFPTSVQVTVAAGETVEGVLLRGDAYTGELSGRVTGPDTLPLPNASVWACTIAVGGGCGNATTDASGAYVISGLPDGNFTVSASAAGFNASTVSANVSGGGATTGVDFMLERPHVVPPTVVVGHVDGDQPGAGAAPVFPSHPTAVSVRDRCTGASVSYEVRGADGSLWDSGLLSESPTTPGTYAGEIAALSGVSGRGVLTITVDCPPGVDDPPDVEIDVYIDPSGTIFDQNGDPVSGATVTLLRSNNATGPFEVVPDGSDIMSPENRTNPDITGEDGRFAWLTVPGFYKVRAEKDGCRSPLDAAVPFVETPSLPVPPEQVGLELVLDCAQAPSDTTPPDVSVSFDREPNAAGWYDADVTATLAATDDDSGVAMSSMVVNSVATASPSANITDGIHEVYATATDVAGNTADSSPDTVRVDSVDPAVTFGFPNASEFPMGAEIPAEYSCSDALSGVESCVGTVDAGELLNTSAPGVYTVGVTATDVAGNVSTDAISYRVLAPATAKDFVELQLSGSVGGAWSGEASTGNLVFTRDDDGTLRSIKGSVMVPNGNGGEARVVVDVNRFWLFDVYFGSIRIVDRSSKVNVSTPLFFSSLTDSADGTVSGSNEWFTGFFQPFTLRWSLSDGEVSGAAAG